MKKFLLIIALFVLQNSFGQQNTTTYYFIRHAEKADNSKNPVLSEIGLERAKTWNKIFSEIDFDQIYTTDYIRTQQTASPAAVTRKINIKLYDPKTIVIDSFKKETVGKKVLIVGHSNSTPDFVNKIINKDKYTAIDENTFGNLYIITVSGNTITHQLLKLP